MNVERFLETLFETAHSGCEPDPAMLAEARHKLRRDLDLVRRPQAGVGLIESPLGRLLVAMGTHGIAMIHYVKHGPDLADGIARLRRRFDPVPDETAAKTVGNEVDRFMAADPAALQSKVDLSLVTGAFQKTILERLCDVGPGEVVTYQALGAWAGAPRAPRAVGGAMHDNPVPIYVPCHRVIRSDGSLGGYGGGLEVKRKLLGVEGFSITSKGLVADGDAVWGNRGTRIFCRPGCRALARADRSRLLLFRDASRAAQAGMRSCQICVPQ